MRRWGTIRSPQVRAALYYARKRRLDRQEKTDPEPDPEPDPEG